MAKRNIRRPTFRSTLIRISAISVVTTLIIAWLFISATSLLSLRQYAEKNLQLLASTVSHSVEAAVVFRDAHAARDTLAQLGRQGQFASAVVTDSDGEELARWAWPEERTQHIDPLGEMVSHWLFPRPVEQPIEHNGQRIGTLTLTGEDSTVTRFVYRSLAVLTLCLLLAALVALLITRRLHRGLVSALQTITGVVHEIRATRQFSRRVPPSAISELYAFGEDFNSLLNEMEKWQRREQQERDSLLQRALRDPLTGLANRAAFTSALDSVLSDAERKLRTALLFMDGDGFKSINDRFGHAAGDEVLQSIASRLSECAGSRQLACRFGGDEFAMILEGLNDEDEVQATIAAIHLRMEEPVVLSSGVALAVRLSIGYAVACQAATAEALMEAADRSMYSEKEKRRPRVA